MKWREHERVSKASCAMDGAGRAVRDDAFCVFTIRSGSRHIPRFRRKQALFLQSAPYTAENRPFSYRALQAPQKAGPFLTERSIHRRKQALFLQSAPGTTESRPFSYRALCALQKSAPFPDALSAPQKFAPSPFLNTLPTQTPHTKTRPTANHFFQTRLRPSKSPPCLFHYQLNAQRGHHAAADTVERRLIAQIGITRPARGQRPGHKGIPQAIHQHRHHR